MRLIDATPEVCEPYLYDHLDDLHMIAAQNAIDDMPTVDAVPVCVLKEILMQYFDIGDSYHFELTRVKKAFEVGTMDFDDFQEWTEGNVDDLVDYIKKNCSNGERKGGDE